MKKTYISMNIRNLTRFFVGAVFLITFLVIIIRQDARLLYIFGIVIAYLLMCLFFFSFTYCTVSDQLFTVRGDFMFNKKQQIQKPVSVRVSDIISVKMSNLKDHMNTNGVSIPYKFKYGDERLFIYGLENLKCIEMDLSDGSKVQFITNKYSAKQVEKIFQSLSIYVSRTQN